MNLKSGTKAKRVYYFHKSITAKRCITNYERMYFYTVYGCVVDTLAEDNYVSFAFCLSVRAYVLPHSVHCILFLFCPSASLSHSLVCSVSFSCTNVHRRAVTSHSHSFGFYFTWIFHLVAFTISHSKRKSHQHWLIAQWCKITNR